MVYLILKPLYYFVVQIVILVRISPLELIHLL